MNKVAIIVLFLIAFNMSLVFFGMVGFFSYQPEGILIEYDLTRYGFDNIVVDGFIIAGIGLLSYIVATLVRINAFALIMFCEVFWFPYIKTSAIFWEVLSPAPVAFLFILGIFTTLMLFAFAYALIEMSNQFTGG